IWIFFALCSSNLFRMISFFGIVSGPILVMNLAALSTAWVAAGKFQRTRRRARGWASAGLIRALMIPVLLAFCFLAWPGWIAGPIGEFAFSTGGAEKATPRRVNWALTENPSLQQTALHLGKLKRDGQMGRVFNFSFDLADYCAWFAPDVKCCIDFRWPLFAASVQEYGKT